MNSENKAFFQSGVEGLLQDITRVSKRHKMSKKLIDEILSKQIESLQSVADAISDNEGEEINEVFD